MSAACPFPFLLSLVEAGCNGLRPFTRSNPQNDSFSPVAAGASRPRESCSGWRAGFPGQDALLLHGHLDVVPAAAEDWQVDPFSGEVEGGYVWGRGAVDMKDFDAMALSVLRARVRAGRLPERPIVLAMTADEEAGGHLGAQWLVEEHPDLVADCTEAVGEVGGFSATVRDRRVYLIEAAEKGMAWMRLTARGRAGHGSMINHDNAVTSLATAVARIGSYEWPVRLTPTMEVLLGAVGELAGVQATPENAVELVEEFGGAARMLGAVIRNTANPTMFDAGYKVNVVPGSAEAHVDGRFLPGYEEEFFADLDRDNSRRWMEAARPRYQFAVREPMVELCEELADRYVGPVLRGEYGWDVEAEARPGKALTSICKNDYGRSAPYQTTLWLTFYPRSAGSRRQAARSSEEAGSSVKKNVAPSFTAACAQTRPPCLETIRWTIARPMPVPSNSDSRCNRWNGEKSLSA